MSIVANYARINESDLDKFALDPEKLYTESIECIDIDRSWDPMSWLVSECKRAEHSYNQLVMQSMLKQKTVQSKPGFFQRLFKKTSDNSSIDFLKSEQNKLSRYTVEPILIGIEGRGLRKEPRIDFGYGEACIFAGQELELISQAFNENRTLESTPDFEKMDSEQVFPEHWREEGDDLFKTYILANFNRLKTFYGSALNEKQIVVMWYS
jgi:hypothetical protein